MKKLLWVLIFLFPSFFAEASHQIGGSISLQQLSGYTYQIDIEDDITYCDSLQDTMHIYFGDGTSELLSIPNGRQDTIGLCTCHAKIRYSITHTFPGPGTYHIWFDAAPRAADIVNMLNSANTDMVVYNTLTILPTGIDSLLIIADGYTCNYGCTSECYHYNPNVLTILPTVDSFSYLMGECLSIGGIAPGYVNPGATINAVTGELSWCNPGSDGLWNFAILIIAYQTTHEIIGIDTIKIVQPIDTEEVEMQVIVQNDCDLGINAPTANSEGVSVYPNPTNGQFTFDFNIPINGIIEIYDITGREVFSQMTSDNYQLSINLSGQPNGMYFYQVINNNGSLIKEGKLVIVK